MKQQIIKTIINKLSVSLELNCIELNSDVFKGYRIRTLA